MTQPEVGRDANVPPELYLTHGRDDFAGGLCGISDVSLETLGGKTVPFVEFEERPGYRYNWNWLMEQQDQLRERFGDQRGYPDPDERPEFNEDWR